MTYRFNKVLLFRFAMLTLCTWLFLILILLHNNDNYDDDSTFYNKKIFPFEKYLRSKSLLNANSSGRYNGTIHNKAKPIKRKSASFLANGQIIEEHTHFDSEFDSKQYLNIDLKHSVKKSPIAIYEYMEAGEMGKKVILPTNMSKSMRKEVDEGWKRFSYNKYISDRINLRRSLPDPRSVWCKEPGRYWRDLPQTDVIICFRDEAWSVLLRTIHSVFDRSPNHLIRNIIVVDDFSKENYINKLKEYWAHEPRLIIIRNPKTEGLTRARLIAYKYSTAPVVTFLDSHCECGVGWLEPILDGIARNNTRIMCPVVDHIKPETFEYEITELDRMYVVTFDWGLFFKWVGIPDREQKRRKHEAEPFFSPAMNGGIFSIHRAFFDSLGNYDEAFNIWGAENIELSLKAWMCGGSVETIPCSHVGHLFRKLSPPWYWWKVDYSAIVNNLARVAEVWMDDYAKLFYESVGLYFNQTGIDVKDIERRKEFRKTLKCHNFKWYLDNILPELFIPYNAIAFGEIRSLVPHAYSLCVDAPDFDKKSIILYGCHNKGGNQFFMYSRDGEIRKYDNCLDYFGTIPMMLRCHGGMGNQLWIYDDFNNQIKHVISNLCLSVDIKKNRLLMEQCSANLTEQKFKWQHFNATALMSKTFNIRTGVENEVPDLIS